MKDKKLRDTQQYLAERTRHLDSDGSFAESSQFKTREGHLRTMRFDVIPFEGITSVKQVFDTLLYCYFFNMEISVSEVLGDITIREDDGVKPQGISHNHLISNLRDDDVQVETNSVMFGKLFEANAQTKEGEEVGVLVANYVAEDELYPYSLERRLRIDVTAAVTLSLQSRQKAHELGEVDKEEELIVVLNHTCLQRMYRADLPLHAHEMEEFHWSIEAWGGTMINVVRGILHPRRAIVRNAIASSTMHKVAETYCRKPVQTKAI